MNSLSGGEKQRTAIARSIIRQPKVILADEPTGNLDSENKTKIFELLSEVSKELLVIVVTHDVDNIRQYCDRIIRLLDGKVIEDIALGDISDGQVALNTLKEERLSPSENVGRRNNKQCKMSNKSILRLSKAFNAGQSVKRIVYAVATIILVCLLTTTMTWSLLIQEKSIFNTMSASKNMAMSIEQQKSRMDEEAPRYKSDLTELGEYMSGRLGIKTARIYPKWAIASREKSNSVGVAAKDTAKYSMYDSQLINSGVSNVIVAKDLAELNLTITDGRMAVAHNEVVIPRSKADAMIGGMKFVYGVDKNGEIIGKDIVSMQDIFDQEFGDIRVVGVFDDQIDFSEEYKKYAYQEKERLNRSQLKQLTAKEFSKIEGQARQEIERNFLLTCVIVSEGAENYYNAMMYTSISGGRNRYRENDIKAKLSNARDPFNGGGNDVSLMPQNSYTAGVLAGEPTLNEDEVLVSKYLLDTLINMDSGMKFKVGDKIKLSTFVAHCEKEDYTDIEGFKGYSTINNIADSKEFVIAGVTKDAAYVPRIVMTDGNFALVTGGIKMQITGIFANHKGMKVSDLNKITTFIGKNIAEINYSNGMTTLRHNNDNNLNESVEIAIYIKYMVGIALTVGLCVLIGIFTYFVHNSSIKAKASEVLILKSLGARRGEIVKIMAVNSVVLCLVQLAVGLAVGSLVVWLISGMAASVVGASFVMFGFDAVAMCLVAGGVLAINVAAVVGGIVGINDKNLRKAFQKAKL